MSLVDIYIIYILIKQLLKDVHRFLSIMIDSFAFIKINQIIGVFIRIDFLH